jgi:hypothetical protein
MLAASGLGRTALVGLDVEHIGFTTTAAELSLGAVGKRAGQRMLGEGRGVQVVIRRSADRGVCPVQHCSSISLVSLVLMARRSSK